MTFLAIYHKGSLLCYKKTADPDPPPVNNAPVASNSSYTVTDQSLAIDAPGLIALCSDYENSLYGVFVVSQPAEGTVSVNLDGSFSYQRSVNTAYTTSFTYRAQDTQGLFSNTATITLTVEAMPVVVVPPTVTNKSYTSPAGQPYSVAAPGLLTGATGEGPLTCYKVSDPLHGTVTVNTNGSFTYTPTSGYTGADSFTFRAYNGVLYSTPGTVSITVVAVNEYTIDAAWLATRIAPYQLGTSNSTYTLDVDVTTNDTAFVVTASNVTLDLNGHTITYNNRAPIDVTNGRWTSGTIGNAPPNWDVSHVASAVLAANNPARPAANVDKVLVVQSSGVGSYIESETVAITHAPHQIAAMSWVRGDYASVVRTAIVDADTGVVLKSGTHTKINRGIALPVTYNVSSPINVKVRVYFDSVGTWTVGQIHLAWSHDHGILSTRSLSYLPVQITGLSYSGNIRYAGATTIKNGSLVQGSGAGYSSSAVYNSSNRYLTFDNMSVSNNGVDSDSITGQYGGNATITNSSFDVSAISNISDRMNAGTVIFYSLSNGYTITDNVITGCPRMGIWIATGTDITIQRNTISPDSIVTEAYGVCVYGAVNCDISYNTITTTTSGRGIFVDALDAATRASANVKIHHNTVDIEEGVNFEYSKDGLEATALRLRDYKNVWLYDVEVYENTFKASTRIDKVGGAIGLRLSGTSNTQGIDALLRIHDNTFTAINHAGSGYEARALSLDYMPLGSNPVFTDNVASSNQISLSFGSNDSAGGGGERMISTVCDKNALGATMSHYSMWFEGEAPSDIILRDNQYTNGAVENYSWGNSSGTLLVHYERLLTVIVLDSNAVPIAGALVTLTDSFYNVVTSTTTDATGRVSDVVVRTKTYSGVSPGSPTLTQFAPHSLAISKSGYVSHSESVPLATPRVITVNLAAV